MNPKMGTAFGALACVTMLLAGGILAGPWAAGEEHASSVMKKESSAGPSADAIQERSKALPVSPLAGTGWRLVYFQSMDDAVGTVYPDDPALYTMRLEENGLVTMRLDCNRASGTWSAEPGGDGASGRFEFGSLASTRAICPSPRMGDNIVMHAQYIRSYLLKDGRLHLSLFADGGIYAWELVNSRNSADGMPASPDDGGPLGWEVNVVFGGLNLREKPSTRARIVGRYAAGTILDNLGCQPAAGRIWCDVQTLGGGARGFVAAEFLKPAVSPDGTVAIGPDNSALRAGRGEFDATGHIPCAQAAGQPMAQCEFGAARAGGGYTVVIIKKPDGASRAVFFRMGRPVGADTSEADGSFIFRAVKENDLHLIRVGSERYEIPDAVVFGD